MAMQIRKAERKRAKLRCALFGPSGSGKTMSALKLAFGLADGGKIGMVDTEHGSGELYAELGDYDVIELEAPYTVLKYREAISTFERAGYSVVIIDSLTHAWAGEGGLLDKQSGLVTSGKYKSSFDAWREVTPDQNKLIEELLNSPAHIIGTMRTKVEWVVEENEKGKKVPRKIGLAPIQREGMEYEFTVVLDIADNHVAHASKDRTSLFAGWNDVITEETGHKLLTWLNSGADPVREPPKVARPKPVEPPADEPIGSDLPPTEPSEPPTADELRERVDWLVQENSRATSDLRLTALQNTPKIKKLMQDLIAGGHQELLRMMNESTQFHAERLHAEREAAA